jgi:hypothetical protein
LVSRLAGRALRWLRLAETNLNGPHAERSDERGPDGLALPDWLLRLREQASALRLPRQRPESSDPPLPLQATTFEKLPHADAFRTGTPFHLAVVGGQPPEIKIRSVSSWAALSELTSIGLLGVAVGGLGLLMLLFGRTTRPEQVAAAGVIGGIAFGWPAGLPFVVLVLLGLLLRLGWAGRRLVGWLAVETPKTLV